MAAAVPVLAEPIRIAGCRTGCTAPDARGLPAGAPSNHDVAEQVRAADWRGHSVHVDRGRTGSKWPAAYSRLTGAASAGGLARAATARLLPLLAALVLLACSAAPAAEPTAAEIRTRSADAMGQLHSFRFTLEVLNGAMPLGGGLAATSIDGAVAAPNRLRMTVKARAANMPLELQVVGVGDRQHMTNPLTGQWQDATGALALPRLLDPGQGLASTLRGATALESRGRQSQAGVDAFHLVGPVPAEQLARLVGAAQPAPGAVQTELWIATADYRLRRARLVGAIVADEAPSLERVLTLSDFDVPVQIEAPP